MNTLIAIFVGMFAMVSGWATNTKDLLLNRTETVSTSTAQNSLVASGSEVEAEAEVKSSVFTDPEGRYRLSVPVGMTYEYRKTSKTLFLWSRREDERGVQFSIGYLSPEGNEYKEKLTDEEKNRVITSKTGEEITVYDPFATEACHEEGSVPVKDGGFLIFYSVCGDNELRPWFDKIINGVELVN